MFNAAITRLIVATGTVLAQIADPGVRTDFAGYEKANALLGYLKWFGLAGSLASFFIGGAVWGLSQQSGNSMAASRGRNYALGGAAGAVIVGLAVTVVNQLSSL